MLDRMLSPCQQNCRALAILCLDILIYKHFIFDNMERKDGNVEVITLIIYPWESLKMREGRMEAML